MAWTKESGRVPTEVGRILIELFDQPFIDEKHEATVNSLDTWLTATRLIKAVKIGKMLYRSLPIMAHLQDD